MNFSADFLDEIKSRVPLSTIVGRHVTWHKKSRAASGDYWACCPAHSETNPSFHVLDRKGFAKCFSCGFSAGHFKFLQEIEGVSFPRAVEIVADLAGLPLPNRGPMTAAEIAERDRRAKERAAADAKRAKEAEKDKARRVMSAGAIWKETVPLAGTPGAAYFEWRGLPAPTDKNLRFHLGLEHPELPFRLRPCIIARVQGPDGKGIGIWRIYLQPDGQGKLAGVNPKLGLGPTAGGAVRLDGMAKHIGLAEGVETARAVRALGQTMPIWAGLSTSGIIGFAWPPEVETVTVFPDRDSRKIRTRDDGRGVKRSPGLEAFKSFVQNNPGRDIRLGPGPENDDYLELWQRLKGFPVR